jgi:hypothetical protein
VDPPTSRLPAQIHQHAALEQQRQVRCRPDHHVGDDEVAGLRRLLFETRLLVARVALAKALTDNTSVARFGLIKMRQNTPSWGTMRNRAGAGIGFKSAVERARDHGRWETTKPIVNAERFGDRDYGTSRPDGCGQLEHQCVLYLSAGVNVAGGLIPASMDNSSDVDTPIEFMLDDAKAEARA